VCLKCQVGSKVGYVVCEELVGSAVCEELIKKTILDAQLAQNLLEQQMVYKSLYHLFSVLFQESVLDVRLGQQLDM
jgi:hypothetical protein